MSMFPRAWILAAVAAAPLFACAGVARAQGIDLSGGGPIDVTASGGFEWRENEQKVIATDNARAVRGNVTVLADTLIAYYRKKAGSSSAPVPPPADAAKPATPTEADEGNNEVYRLEAEGHVQIFTPTDHAVGDRAIYDIDQAVLVMTGKDMKLTTPQDVMTARDTMEYWSQKHMAVGRGNAVVVTNDGRRISADTLVGYTEDPNAPQAAGAKPAPAVTQAAVKSPDPAQTGKLKRVEAYGNVEVRTAVDIVRGDRGVYVPDTGIARIVGHVRITHGQNQVNGPAADVNMKTGIAHIVSSASERVSGYIVPGDQTAQAAKPGAASAGPAAGKGK